jgi:hypothetical protein
LLQNPTNNPQKNRHGCLTAYLAMMIIVNSIVMFFVPIAATSSTPDTKLPVWYIVVMVITSLFNIVCAFALLGWRKWGFWGFCASNAAGFIVTIIMGQMLILSIFDLAVSTGLLLWVLNIGDKNKGWPQLE